MTVILVFAGLVIVGQAIAVSIAIAAEQISELVGLLVFFALFAGAFVVSWLLAVRIVERYLLRPRAEPAPMHGQRAGN